MRRMSLAVVVVAALAACTQSSQDARRSTLSQAAAVADHALASRPELFPAVSPKVRFVPRGVVLDVLDQGHVRYDQTYQGVPVFEGQVIAHVDLARETVADVTRAARPVRELDVTPTVSLADAVPTALDTARVAVPTEAPGTLMVYVDDAGASHLAWRINVRVDDGERRPVDWMTFVDAHTGAVLRAYDNLHTGKPSGVGGGKKGGGNGGGGGGTTTSQPSVGTGLTLYAGTVSLGTEAFSDGTFGMTDLSRGGLYTTDMGNKTNGSGSLFMDADDVWGDGTMGDAASAAADAHFGAMMTWDFFLNTFGRNGIWDDGKGTLSRVHYGRRYNNAFWSDSCGCMTYGDGDNNVLSSLVSIDVAGHEMTHGITSATANLTYSGESGGLNESISDIFGTMVEFYAAAESSKKANYWIGEDVYTPKRSGDALRYMDHPANDGYSIDNYADYYSGLDVHYSSGIANNVFYLLAEGGRNDTSGMSVSRLGRDQAAQIFYRALTAYMTPGTTFAGARAATVQAATDLYGASAASTVASAWSACGVN